MAEGIVKFFDNEKGYGFINSDNVDYFVHFSNIISDEDYKKLSEGDKVSFEIIDQSRGPSAINVQKVEE